MIIIIFKLLLILFLYVGFSFICLMNVCVDFDLRGIGSVVEGFIKFK